MEVEVETACLPVKSRGKVKLRPPQMRLDYHTYRRLPSYPRLNFIFGGLESIMNTSTLP